MGFKSLAKAPRSPELQDFAMMGIIGRYTRNHLLLEDIVSIIEDKKSNSTIFKGILGWWLKFGRT